MSQKASVQKDFIFIVSYILIMIIVPIMGLVLYAAMGGSSQGMDPQATALVVLVMSSLQLIVLTILYVDYFKTQWRLFIGQWQKQLFYVAIAAIIGIMLNIIFSYFTKVPADNQLQLENLFRNNSVLMQLLLQIPAIVIAPMVEEMIYRKILFGNFAKRRIVYVIMFFVSSCVFAIAHYAGGSIVTLFPYFLMGLVLAFAYDRTNNIFGSISVHMLNNLVASLLFFFW